MKKSIFTILLTGIVQLTISAQAYPKKDYILILHSLNFSEVYTRGTYEALHYTFTKEEIPVTKEELSIASIKDTNEAALKRAKIAHTYPVRPKMVVCIGDPAWILVRPLFDTIWKDVPILLCDSKDHVPKSMDDLLTRNLDFSNSMVPTETITSGYNLTRIKQPIFIDKTITTMKRLIPDLKNIAFISDSRYASIRSCMETRQVVETMYPDLNFEILSSTELSTEKLLNIVSELNDNTGLIYCSWLIPKDERNSKYLTEHLNKLTHSFSNIPVFTLVDMNTSNGNFAGGYFISNESISKTVVSTARKIIGGTPARNIPTQVGGIPCTYLNYKHLLTHNIAPQLYPEEAVYYQVPPSLFSKYKYHIATLSAILLLLFIIISLRLRLYSPKQKIINKMSKSALILEKLNRKYRLILKSSGTTAWEWDINKKEIQCNRDYLFENEAHGNNIYTVPEVRFYSHIHPDDVWKIKRVYDCLIKGSYKVLREEIRIKLTYAPKEYNWVECYAIVGEKKKDGTPRTLVGGVLVITERKLIEEERRIKEEKERMIADSV